MPAKAKMLIRHARHVLKQQGGSALWRLVVKHLKRKAGRYSPGIYDYGYRQWQQTRTETARDYSHKVTPLISILVPVYNVREVWLSEMIRSVLAQSYPHWQLCLVNDCATDEHVARVIDEFAATDHRISKQHNESNQGIAGASARALVLASGAFVTLLDHDDLLPEHALDSMVAAMNRHPEADLFYSDEDKIDPAGYFVSPFFKPEYSPALLRSQNYFGHLVMYGRDLIDRVGGFRPGFDGAQDYDLVLRACEQATEIVHIPEVLYHWRQIPGSTATVFGAKDYAWEAGKHALQQHLDRTRTRASAENGALPGTYRVRHEFVDQPLISIIVPFRDHPALLEQCLRSLLEHTSWPNIEVLAIDNQSTNPEITQIRERWIAADPRIRFLAHDQPFNFSAICNAGVEQAKGEYIVLMNNDIEIRSANWLEGFYGFASESNTGAVGGKLYYPDDSIQHAGIVIGIGGSAGHPFKYFPGTEAGYFSRLQITSNVSAVTAALLMVSKEKYLQVGGLDEATFGIAFNDLDFCLKLLDAGYLNVFTADVEATHHESKSRGSDTSASNAERYANELAAFRKKWQHKLAVGDQYYNPNLTLESEDYRLRGI